MTGLRRAFLHAGWGLCLFTGCSKDLENTLPIAGTGQASDSEASQSYAAAQAADQAGRRKKALTLYDKTADKYPASSVAPLARFRQAQILEEQGKLEKSFEVYELVIQRYQGSALYSKARDSQGKVAHAAASGEIQSNFLWMKSGLEMKKIVSMLESVRNNAPQAPTAAKAQYTIGQVYESKKKLDEAIVAHQRVVDDYPRSAYAPDAQYHIGHILLQGANKGNQDNANLDRALYAFQDLRQSYPNSKRAADAALKITEIRSRDIQRNFDIGEFYFKKGQSKSAALYYQEVIKKTKGGDLHNQAKARLQSIGSAE